MSRRALDYAVGTCSTASLDIQEIFLSTTSTAPLPNSFFSAPSPSSFLSCHHNIQEVSACHSCLCHAFHRSRFLQEFYSEFHHLILGCPKPSIAALTLLHEGSIPAVLAFDWIGLLVTHVARIPASRTAWLTQHPHSWCLPMKCTEALGM